MTAALLALCLAGTGPGTGSCGACHPMASRIQALQQGSHARVAGCADCHLPPGPARWAAGAADGLRHLAAQAFRDRSRPLALREAGARTVQANCLRCHGGPGGHPAPATPATPGDSAHLAPGRPCAACHRDTPHGPPPTRHGTLGEKRG